MNKKNIFVLSAVVLVLGVFLVFVLIRNNEKADKVGVLKQIQIGWQIPWSTQGQLVQVLKHTDILKNNGLVGDFKGFSYGGPLNEAALAGDVDVVLTADQPAATLLAKSDNWTIVGRLMYNRVSLYVPPKSPITSIADLKGKTVAMPFGAAAQRMTLKAEKEAGLDPQKDVKNINLGIYEQSDLVRSLDAEKWGEVDAMAGFDPTPAIFEEKGLVRNLRVDTVVSVIAVSNALLESNPEAVESFLKSFSEAYGYYKNNVSQADEWFVSESGLDVTPKALEIAASVEPNLKEDIRLDFTESDYKILQEAADFIYDQKLAPKRVIMKDRTDMSFLQSALK